MSAQQVVPDLSFPVKLYVGIVHLLLLFLVVLFLQKPRKNGDKDTREGRKSRTFTKDNRAVTLESCEWINSTLAWFFLHAQSHNDKDRTPHIIKLWIRALNKQLQKDKKKGQRIVIESLSPGCLPPKLTSVYCLCVSGNMQCITFHVESADLGFLVAVLHQTADGPKTTYLETRVVKLTGEVALKLSTAPSRLEVSVQFIGVPEIAMATKCLAKIHQHNLRQWKIKIKQLEFHNKGVYYKAICYYPNMGQDSSKQGIGNDVLEQSEETKLQCVIKTSGDASVLNGDSEVDGAEVQEKVKEVICKTITNIPLTADATSRERLSSDAGSATSKERLDSPSSISCIGEEGKLLVKVIKANGLCGKAKTGPISPYCIVSTSNPLQRKRTSMVRDNDSPFWNEYFTFDINPKTKEISLDIYDFEKTDKDCNGHMDDTEVTEEQDDYLGQVIVPLSTVNRDQTCRLILPILPKSSKSEHSKGDISLEFTFDKDGKVIDATLPLVSGLERNVLSSDPDKPSAQSTPSEESPSVYMNGAESGVVNGHIPVRKRYIESSLDELAMEIEAYEHGEEKPKPDGYHNDTHTEESYEEPELHREPASSPVVIATEVAGPSREAEQKEDESEMTIVELLKMSGEEPPEESKEEKGETTEDGKKEKQDEGEEEKEPKGQVDEEQEEKVEEPSLKPKHRRSRNFFKRKKTDKKAAKDEEKVEEKHEPEEEPQEGDKKEETPVEDEEEIKESPAEDKKVDDVHTQEATEDEQKAKEDEEKIEQAAELQTKPKPRFKLFKRRPHSMAAADVKMDEGDEERVLSRHNPVRHSYHAGDLPVPDTSHLRRSTSQSSLLSYSPNPNSTLVIETVCKGKTKYSHIPPVMAKRRAYEKGGNKLHIYNDHVFMAVHFSGSPPDCTVCSKPIKGKIGKQGYQCRGCKIVTHRDCHCETTAMCTSDDVKQMDIEYVGDSEV